MVQLTVMFHIELAVCLYFYRAQTLSFSLLATSFPDEENTDPFRWESYLARAATKHLDAFVVEYIVRKN